MKGSWCPYCAENAKYNLKDLHELGQKKGGKLLSKKYINANVRLLWICKNEHRFYLKPAEVRGGLWCLKCIKFSSTSAEKVRRKPRMYLTSEKLYLVCDNKHLFQLSAQDVKDGKWCPECEKSKSLSPEAPDFMESLRKI